jgi:putative oxidoreductase
MLATTFLSGGMNALKNTDRLAQRAEPVANRVIPTVERTISVPFDLNAKQLVRINAAVQVVGGAMLATGRAPRLASLALATSLVPTTIAGHRFWEESDPLQRSNQRVHFLKNLSMIGGTLLAALDTEGSPSLAWRARRQASQARKQAAKQAAKVSRQAAKSSRRRRS